MAGVTPETVQVEERTVMWGVEGGRVTVLETEATIVRHWIPQPLMGPRSPGAASSNTSFASFFNHSVPSLSTGSIHTDTSLLGTSSSFLSPSSASYQPSTSELDSADSSDEGWDGMTRWIPRIPRDSLESLWNETDEEGEQEEELDPQPPLNNLPEMAWDGEAGETCSICLDLFVVDTRVRLLPCLHHFHVPCIDTWLTLRPTCPVCRLDLFTLPA